MHLIIRQNRSKIIFCVTSFTTHIEIKHRRVPLFLADGLTQKVGKPTSLCWCSWASGDKEKQQTKLGKLWSVWGYKTGDLPLTPVNHVMIQKDVRIPIKNWKLILHKSVAVETSVPSQRWPTGFKAHVTLNRIKVSVKVVMENRASEKILTVFAGNIKDNPIPADFWCRKIGLFGKRIICLFYHSRLCLVKMKGL